MLHLIEEKIDLLDSDLGHWPYEDEDIHGLAMSVRYVGYSLEYLGDKVLEAAVEIASAIRRGR